MAKKAKATSVQPGDVYALKLPDGRYGAVRVLRVAGKSSVVSTTEYLGKTPPSLDDPLLRTTVTQKRFYFKGVKARKWLDRVPPAKFKLVGRVPPTAAEAKIKCDTYGGGWCESSGNEAYLEWRWLHDRAAFEDEVRQESEESERRSRRPQKPKVMMSEQAFWAIIGLLDWSRQGNDEAVLEPAVASLATRSKTDIRQFEERLAYLLYQLDTKAHASNMGENSYDPKSSYVSADGFLYARCVVVANGKKFYDAVLKNPRKMPKDLEFESLLSLAREAYQQKTGDDFDYLTGCSYETFSNPEGW